MWNRVAYSIRVVSGDGQAGSDVLLQVNGTDKEDGYNQVCADLRKLKGAGGAALLARCGLGPRIAELEAEKARLERQKRGQKTTNEQLEQAQSFEKRLLADIAKAAAHTKVLQEKRSELEKEAAEHEQKSAGLQTKLQDLRVEIAGILAELAKEKAPPPPRPIRTRRRISPV